MTRTHRALAVIAAAATASLLAGCGSGGTGAADSPFTTEATGTLKAWAFDGADDVGEARMQHAADALADVTIDLDSTAFDAQKFTTRVASGQTPDVVQMDRQFVATYAAQDLILPLDECYAVNDVDPGERFYESVTNDIRYDDAIWAVPQFFQPPAIILNERVLSAAGVTADQFDTSKPDQLLEAVGKVYRESGGDPAVLGLDAVPTSQAALWMLGFGGQLVDEEGKPTLDDASNLPGLEFLTRLSDAQGGYAKGKSFTDAFDTFGDGNQFATDQVGAQVGAQWYLNVLSPYRDDIDISAVPFRDRDGQPFSVAGGSAFVIPAGAANKDAACAWMLDLTSQDAWEAAGDVRAATVTENGGINTGLFTGSPAADDAVRAAHVVPSGDEGIDQAIATFYDVVAEGRSIGGSPAGQQIQSELQNAVASALLGDKAPEEALADAQTAAMRAYEQAAR
jgi:multiple sugar transport system substrate-binding protein